MSRTPVKVLNESQAREPSDPPVLRLRRAVAGDAGRRAGAPAVSLDVAPGAAHLLLGPAGSGKTALLEAIAMARPPASGEAELFGHDLGRAPASGRWRLRRRVGMIFQTPRLMDELSARQNVAMAVLAAGGVPEDRDGEIVELLTWVGLARSGATPAGALDAEGRRRLALARAVINRPELVIVDEPAGEAAGPILKLLVELSRTGAALLIATADERLGEDGGDRVTRMDGRATDGRR